MSGVVISMTKSGKAAFQGARHSSRFHNNSVPAWSQHRSHFPAPFPSRNFAAKASKKGGKTEEDAASVSYFERKAALKEQRVQNYQHKLERAVQLKHRRDNAPRDVLKNEFRSWWDGRKAYEEIMERKARQAGMEWKIQVATIVERLPVVLPDKMDFEVEFETLHAYLASNTGKEYPVEFTGTGGADRPVALTDEELMALLPENFKPAPRVTKADENGTVNTLDRRLKDRVYLMIDDSFPITEVGGDGDSDESLLEAALRGLGEQISTTTSGKKKKDSATSTLPLDLYCPSQAPLAVKLDVFEPDKQKSSGFFGTKTFFLKVQYDDGSIKGNVDFAWLDRDEIVEKVQGLMGEDDAKLYRYML